MNHMRLCRFAADPTSPGRVGLVAPGGAVLDLTGAGIHRMRDLLERPDLDDELLRLTRMPAIRVDLGYLTSPVDRDRLVNPLFREQVVEAILAAVQRMYYPVEIDVPTGSIDVRQLRVALSNRA